MSFLSDSLLDDTNKLQKKIYLSESENNQAKTTLAFPLEASKLKVSIKTHGGW